MRCALGGLTLAACAVLAAASCQSTVGTGGCAIDRQVALPASPLALLADVHLDKLGPGFVLSGVEEDGITVRWQELDEAGVAAQEQRLVLPAANGGPWLAFTGDTLLVAQAYAAANPADAELKVITVPVTGAPTPAPGASLAVIPGALAGTAHPGIVFGASRTGGHATLAWYDAQAGGVETLTLTPTGTALGKPAQLEMVPPVACLGFVAGKDAATLVYYRRRPGVTSPDLVITELDENGGPGPTLVLFLDSHDAGCPRLVATPSGYTLAFEDGQGAWLGVYDAATNRLTLHPFASAASYPGGIQPPLVGLGATGAGYGVVVESGRAGELWRLDAQGTHAGTLVFPSAQGAIGRVSTVADGASLRATYADYTAVAAGKGTDGQRFFLRASCP